MLYVPFCLTYGDSAIEISTFIQCLCFIICTVFCSVATVWFTKLKSQATQLYFHPRSPLWLVLDWMSLCVCVCVSLSAALFPPDKLQKRPLARKSARRIFCPYIFICVGVCVHAHTYTHIFYKHVQAVLCPAIFKLLFCYWYDLLICPSVIWSLIRFLIDWNNRNLLPHSTRGQTVCLLCISEV
jgi:hypothetical protein